MNPQTTIRTVNVPRIPASLRRVVGAALLVASFCAGLSSIAAAAPVQLQEVDQARAKLDKGWTGITIQFNKSETRLISKKPTAFNFVALAGLPGAVTAIMADLFQQGAITAVNSGRCLQYKKYYVTPVFRLSSYSGGYCK